MNKFMAVLAVAATLSACESFDSSKYTTANANDSVKTRLRACMLSEANAKFQNGTLLVAGISATADEISSTCIKKLALQSAGLDNEATSTATTILNNLRNAAGASGN